MGKKDNLFNLINLPKNNLKEIFQYLTLNNQFKLLLINQKWKEVFLPLIWEYILPRLGDYNWECILPEMSDYSCDYILPEFFHTWPKIKQKIIKYSHFLKYLTFGRCNQSFLYPELCNNATMMSTTLDNYFELDLKRYNLKLIGLEFDEYIGNLSIEEYIKTNKIDLTKILKDLQYLHIPYITMYIIKEVIPQLPATITSIYIGNIDYFDCFDIKLFETLPNLKHLQLGSLYPLDIKQFSFNNGFFNNLLSLISYSNDFSNHIINASTFPHLIYLLFYSSKIIFEGNLKLREIYLFNTNFGRSKFSKENFPHLRVLIFRNAKNANYQLINSLFNLVNLIKLTIGFSQQQYILVCDNIFPKIQNNLISLHLHNFIIDNNLFYFILNSCIKLEELTLSKYVYYPNKIKKPYPTTKTNLTSINLDEYDRKLDPIFNILFKLSPKLKSISLKTVPDGFSEIRNYLQSLHIKNFDNRHCFQSRLELGYRRRRGSSYPRY